MLQAGNYLLKPQRGDNVLAPGKERQSRYAARGKLFDTKLKRRIHRSKEAIQKKHAPKGDDPTSPRLRRVKQQSRPKAALI